MIFWIIGFLTGVLILDCVFLVLLIMVQLPKKEAGLGQAFGGGATDALFGAGSGNALTKMTKYSTAIFLVLTLSLSILRAHNRVQPNKLQENIQKLGKGESAAPVVPATTPVTTNLITPVQPESPAKTTNTAPKAAVPAPATTTGTNASAPAPK